MGQPSLGGNQASEALFWSVLLLGFVILIESLSHPRREAQITVRGHDVEVKPLPLERTA